MATAPPWMRPRGWFQVGWSGEIGSGQVRTVRCFGRDVVLYRDADGSSLHALDSRCQHLREMRRFCRKFEPLATEPAEAST